MNVTKVKYRRFPKRLIITVILIGLGVLFLATFHGGFRHHLSQLKDKVLHGSANSRLGESAIADTLSIEMSDSSYQVISDCRDRAIDHGLLTDINQQEVKAKLFWRGEKVKCKLRLKGDYPDHWNGDKWSFRINVKGQSSINGMDKFSIQNPATRKDLNEWYYQKLLESEGLINLKYQFVHIKINGRYKGIYAMEESFSKELIEQNERRNGPILKFEESEWISQIIQDKPNQVPQLKVFMRAEIKAFGMKKIARDSVMSSYFERGKYLLGSLRKNELDLDEVVDIKKAAMLFAIADLTGAYHGMRWHNQRFYYNPIIDKLEMIGFDSGSGVAINETFYQKWSKKTMTDEQGIPEWKDRFFSSPSFRAYYLEALRKISGENYLAEFHKTIETQLENNLYLMYQENNIYKFNKNCYSENAKVIREFTKSFDSEPLKAEVSEHHSARLQGELFQCYTALKSEGVLQIKGDTLLLTSDLKLSENLIIPDSFVLKIKPGTSINLIDKSQLISFSPIIAIGDSINLISIFSEDSSGSILVKSDELSTFNYVSFEGLTAQSNSHFNYSGGINFHESKVEMSNCSIRNSHSEDAINFVNSAIQLRNILFENIKSDALDGDFCTGHLDNIQFIEIGNDALDFSGSKISIGYFSASHIGDKAISAGEQSIIKVKKASVTYCALGVVSKDYSYLQINEIDAAFVDVLFIAFQKKREFGGGHIRANSAHINTFVEKYLLENGSSIELEEKHLVANCESVIEKIYGNEYGKVTVR